MRISFGIKNVIPASLLAVVLLSCFSASAYAAPAVTLTEGVVIVDQDGTVGVVVCDERSCEVLIPSNGQGLLRSGQIAPGDLVDVLIVQDKKHKHRGHVTVLK